MNTDISQGIDLDAWKDAGLGDPAFRELESLPGIPNRSAASPADTAVAEPVKRQAAAPLRTHWEKVVAGWPEGKDFDQPSGQPLLKEVKFLRPEDRTLVQKSALMKNFGLARERTQKLFDAIVLGDLNQAQGLIDVVESLMGLMSSDPHATLAFTLMRSGSLGEYQYRHAVNTSTLAIATAMASGFSRDQVRDIGLGGLIADIGMLLVPDDILNKTEKLAAEELAEIHRHVQYGADLLERVAGIQPTVLTVILQHHERLAGAGYPRHLKAEGISHAARVVAIADTLAAMVHKRSHRNAMLAQEAVDRVIKMGRMQFLDSTYIRYLAGWLSAYPVGVGVLLQSGYVGRVIAANLDDFNRPVIALLKAPGGQWLPLKQISTLDMRQAGQETIVRCLDDQEADFKGLEGF